MSNTGSKPTELTGQVRIDDEGVTLAAATTYNADSIELIGDVSEWPDSDFVIKIEDELIHVGTRTENIVSSLARGHQSTDHNHHPYACGVFRVLTGIGLDHANGGSGITTGDGSPVGVLAPASVGQLYIDTTGAVLWISYGLGESNWVCVGGNNGAGFGVYMGPSGSQGDEYIIRDSLGMIALKVDDVTDAETGYGSRLTSASNTLDDGTTAGKATLQTLVVGAGGQAQYKTNTGDPDADIQFVAQAGGSAGNAITISYVNDGDSESLTVTVDGTDITVHLATDSGGTVTSTASDVQGAVNGDGDAAALVSCGTTGSGADAIPDDFVPFGPQNLSGGKDALTLNLIPSSDPEAAGVVWNDDGTLKVSAG